MNEDAEIRRRCAADQRHRVFECRPGCNPRLYNFSPVNQQSLQVSAGFWNPILAYVSAKSGVELNLKLGRTSADTTAHVLAQEVDFAFTNHLFSPERAKLGWRVFGRRDAPPIRAQIVTAADVSVKTLAELANQEVAFQGPEAFIAYKVPYAHLISSGVAVMHRDPEGRAILERARELIGAPAPVVFVPAVEADYQGYRQFYRTAPPQLR